MQKTKINNLVWFRNDRRTSDNTVLVEACKDNNSVIGIYCFDPRHFDLGKFGFRKTEKFRAKFLIETIIDLKAQLDKLNIDLLIYNELPETVIPKVCEDLDIDFVFFQKEWTTEEHPSLGPGWWLLTFVCVILSQSATKSIDN